MAWKGLKQNEMEQKRSGTKWNKVKWNWNKIEIKLKMKWKWNKSDMKVKLKWNEMTQNEVKWNAVT